MKLSQSQFDDFRSMAVPIEELMADPSGLAPRYFADFKRAELIVGYDIGRPPSPSESMVLFHGLGKSGVLSCMCIAYDQRTDQLEKLIACCMVHRGGCDYRASGEPSAGPVARVDAPAGMGKIFIRRDWRQRLITPSKW